MEFLRKAVRVGNSSGVILPKKLLGSEVRIIVVKKLIDIKKEAMKILEDYLSDLMGIYVINNNPAEVLAVSSAKKEIINKESIKISVVPLSIIKKDIKTNQKLKEKLMKAGIIFNKALLYDLRKQAD